MLLSFVTSNAFIITIVCILFFFLLGGITIYRTYKENENENIEVNEDYKNGESN